MNVSRQGLCIVYALAGLVALVGTWSNNLHYFNQGMLAANLQFWQETMANPASRSITIDILLFGFVGLCWMLLEARRLAMRHMWVYVLASMFIAISAAFPAFLIHRERVLAAREGGTSAGTLGVSDLLWLVLVGAAGAGYTVLALPG
jgi:Terpene cyclase DEP1